jgi:hypothetical protein
MHQEKNRTLQERYVEQIKCLKVRKDKAIPVTGREGP